MINWIMMNIIDNPLVWMALTITVIPGFVIALSRVAEED